VHDAQHEHADISVLESLDAPSAAVAVGKEREGVASDLIEKWIAAATEERHRCR
jgi:hypothetical protein